MRRRTDLFFNTIRLISHKFQMFSPQQYSKDDRGENHLSTMPIRLNLFNWIVLAAASAAISGFAAEDAPWPRHTIASQSRGADGARFADLNGDGLPDDCTPWEEGGRITVSIHPGYGRVRDPWPTEFIGAVPSPEDALLVDLDGDGRLDAVTSAEGEEKCVWVHWNNGSKGWSSKPFPLTKNLCQWMYALPMRIAGGACTDLFIAGKNENAKVGWLESSDNPRDLSAWTWHPLYDAGWIMSLIAADIDGDGADDLLFSDRRGATRGIHWLKRPSEDDVRGPWRDYLIGGNDAEVMFIDYGDIDQDKKLDIVAATSHEGILLFHRESSGPRDWSEQRIAMPPDAGTGKSAGIGDLDGDGKMDIAITCEHSEGKHGVFWLSYQNSPRDAEWTFHPISGPEGTKFDRLKLIDLDGDGDLDLVTCEEREDLGVIWYENPAKTGVQR
ncbi:MAG: hypothetical protein GC154_07815 [bacterium]|nr:hypothetical protein [bacterium]